MNPATTNRFEAILDRSRRSRILDVLFAGMIAMLMVFFVTSLGSAAARPLSKAPAAKAAIETFATIGTCSADAPDDAAC